jgi:CheY-like chemotaxis protein
MDAPAVEEATMDESPHIFIVAAAPALRFTLEELLRAYGYDVSSVASATAVEALASLPPCAAVLTACSLPQTGHYEPAPSPQADWPEDEWTPV